jgi:hypothetical protein
MDRGLKVIFDEENKAGVKRKLSECQSKYEDGIRVG